MTLYQKWRPQTFAEIVGQEPIVRTLQNAIEHQRVSHAYLFTGPRGTGKTSLARILAKALNCEKGEVREPCGTCSICQRIRDGFCVDVLEMDAASNRGIDEIREIRERVRFVPVEARKKVYIIDEVHMLTSEAFNALLKTLEEPPAHVLFILATTEPHKVPATIASRCQRFDFVRLPSGKILEALRKVASAETIAADDRALRRIVRAAEGSMRDALSLLDQVGSFCEGVIREEDVDQILGSVTIHELTELLAALRSTDPAVIFNALDRLSEKGVHIPQLSRDFLHFVREILISLAGAGEEVWWDPETKQKIDSLSQAIPLTSWKSVVDRLARVESEMRWHSFPRIVFEVALLDSMEMLSIRSEEKREAEPGTPRSKREGGVVAAGGGAVVGGGGGPTRSELSGVSGGASSTFLGQWSRFMAILQQKDLEAYVALLEAQSDEPTPSGEILILFRKGFSLCCEILKEPKHIRVIEETLEEIFGQRLSIRVEQQDLLGSAAQKQPPREKRIETSSEELTASVVTLEDVKEVFGVS